VIGLIQVGDQWMADRYTYIPMLGLVAAIVVEVALLANRGKAWSFIVMGVSFFVCTSLALATREQIQVWKDSATVADAAIAIDGGHWSMRTNKAISLSQNGHMSEALAIFRQIYIDFPNDAEAANNLGFTLLSMNRHREAVVVLEAAVRAEPKNHKFRVNLGQALLGTGAQEKALECFAAVFQADPNDPTAPLFAAIAVMKSNPASAVRYAQRAFELSPQPAYMALEVLADAKLHAGDRAGAIATLKYAAQLAKTFGNNALESGLLRKADSF
jgi:tetratricopeptide (TPR) repeat protein